MDDIINKIFPQTKGEFLKVIEKTNIKNSSKEFLYKCEFLNYTFICLKTKREIIKGTILNPQIEQVEFIEKIWPQNCGDSLKILRKSDKKSGNNYYFECEFTKYPYKVLAKKQNILKGTVLNPQIEQVEFIDKIWPQNCGDDLKILRKTEEKKQGNNYYFECEFIKYPCVIYAKKYDILNKNINNPQIEQVEFIEKIWPQNCGDSLKILRKTNKKDIKGNYYFECEFLKYSYKVLALKKCILNGKVDNLSIPYKNKNNFEKFLKDNIKHKITLLDLSKIFSVSCSTIGRYINDFKLNSYILYSYKELENNIKYIINDEIINNKNIEIQSSYWNKELKKELDIYIPNFNLGIEVNGNYWHSNLYKKQNYHQEKSLKFQERKINILHIWEWEWLDKQEILKSLIKSKLGIFEKKIYARQCEIKELEYQEYASFCNKNHLQGEAGAKVKLGLYYQNELTQVMSFGSPRFTDKYEWEIIRECSKLGYIILGGKEKLWSYFLKNHNPNSVISYCDFSKFNGESYLKLGFEKIGLNKPGFVWYDEKTQQIFWRNPYKHKEMKEAGYLKIYDAGQLVFVWNK